MSVLAYLKIGLIILYLRISENMQDLKPRSRSLIAFDRRNSISVSDIKKRLKRDEKSFLKLKVDYKKIPKLNSEQIIRS